MTETDFFQKTHLIFVGKLLEKKSYWSDDGRFILTRHIFQVGESIKGDPGERVEITEYGGTVGNRAMTVSHVAYYRLNREYLVFSYLDSFQRNRTLAGPLGQFQVITNRSTQRMIRIYPSHPLSASLSEGRISTFQELNAFSTRLRTSLEKFRALQD
ncbi:hypothetical protein MYX82_13235 [Acidobacteria bacterium AH-259-D05]|nr:hypothetical protein [Acidobacteria bacterium AH-259-D05]